MESVVRIKSYCDLDEINEVMKYSMSVKELIAILNRCPSDAKVVFTNDGFTFGEVSPNAIRVIEVEK